MRLFCDLVCFHLVVEEGTGFRLGLEGLQIRVPRLEGN